MAKADPLEQEIYVSSTMVVQPTECQILVRDTLQLLHLYRVLYMRFWLAQAVCRHGHVWVQAPAALPTHIDYVLELVVLSRVAR
jgi:hypothetical protein